MSMNINLYEKDIKNLNIDSSLNAKLIENENKLQAIMNIPKKKYVSNSTDRNVINKDRNKKNLKKNKNSNKKIFKNFKTDYNSFDYKDNENHKNINHNFSPKRIVSSIDYEFDSDNSYNNNKIIKVNQKIKRLIKNSNKHSTIDTNTSRNKTNKIRKKIIYNMKEKSNPKLNSNHNNLNKSNHKFKNYNTIDYCEKRGRYCSPTARSINIEEMIIRFKKDQNKKEEWIEKQKKKKEEDEKKICSYAPKINKNKKINLKIKDDFLTRQKFKDEQKKKKEEKLKEFLNKKKEEEINKNNFLLKKKEKGKNKEKSIDNNGNKKKNESLEKNKKIEINNAINKLYAWDLNRKEKINQKRKKNNEKIEKIKHIPKINKRSSSMAELKKKKYYEQNIFDRLAKKDPEMLEKQRLLVQLYTPTFHPNIYTKRFYPKKDEDKEEKSNFDEYEIDSKNDKLKTIGITNLSNQFLNDEDIQQLYRDTIFKNKKRHIKSKSIY